MPIWPELILLTTTIFAIGYIIKLKQSDRMYRRKLYQYLIWLEAMTNVTFRYKPDISGAYVGNPDVQTESKSLRIGIVRSVTWNKVSVQISDEGVMLTDNDQVLYSFPLNYDGLSEEMATQTILRAIRHPITLS